MNIQNLSSTPLESIVEALLESFKNYFVPLSNDIEFWRKRLTIAKYAPQYSVGVFDQGKLVGFILHCLDDDLGKYTAFNTGTGILEAYRGQDLVSRMYDYILPVLLEQGVEKLKLEVIQQNIRAIKAYEKVGLSITKSLDFYKLDTESVETAAPISIEKIKAKHFQALSLPCSYQSWDNRMASLDDYEGFSIYLVKEKLETIGYFIINEPRLSIAQIENYGGDWDKIFGGIKNVNTVVTIANLSTERTDLVGYLREKQASLVISQYEMEKLLK